MHSYRPAILLTMTTLLLGGCNDQDQPSNDVPIQEQAAPDVTPHPSVPTRPAAAAPDQHNLNAITQEGIPTDVVEEAQDLLGGLEHQKDRAMDQLNQAAQEAQSQTSGVKNLLESAQSQEPTAAANALDDPTAPASQLAQQAQSLLGQVLQYTNEHKLDLAEQGLRQLEQMGPSLPQSLQEKIAQAQNLYKTTKATVEAQKAIPSLP